MSSPVLYCKCIYTQYISLEAKDFFEAVLNSGDNEIFTVDDLCGLAAKDQGDLNQVVNRKGLTLIACHPRAVKWLLASLGIPKKILETINYINIYRTPWTDIFNSLSCNLSDEDEKKITGFQKELDRLLDNDQNSDKAITERDLALASAKDSKRPWFPVIDYDRCKNCGACMDFCLFGVYEAMNKGESGKGTIDVKNPMNCKDNCPACARICPHNAIIFPKYDRPPINGDLSEYESNKKHKPPIFSLSGDELFKALSKRNKKSRGLYKK